MRGQLLEDARVSHGLFTLLHCNIDLFSEFIDLGPSRNILCLSRSVMGRAASVFVAWQRDAVVRHDAGLQARTGITILENAWAHTPVTRADGPSACPGDSSHERGASAQATTPGTWSKPRNPSACGTQASSRVRGFVTCRVPSGARAMCSAHMAPRAR